MLNDITVLDFETTDFSSTTGRVIEMAALRIRDGIEIACFNTLVHQIVPINAKAKEVHGIEEAHLINATDEELAFKILRNLMGDSVIVAHNAPFDLRFLDAWMRRVGGFTFSNPFLDTLEVARLRYPAPHKLTDLCTRLGIPLDGAHRALNDVRCTAALLKIMHDESPLDKYIRHSMAKAN